MSKLTKVQSAILNVLVEMGGDSKAAVTAQRKLKKSRDGAYSVAMRAAYHAETAGNGKADFEAAFAALETAIRANDVIVVGDTETRAATHFGAPKAKKPSDGQTHNLPQPVMTAKSRILDGFNRGLSMVDGENNDEPKSYTQLNKDIKADKEREAAAETAAAIANLTGDDAVRAEIVATCQAICKASMTISGANLASLNAQLTALFIESADGDAGPTEKAPEADENVEPIAVAA